MIRDSIHTGDEALELPEDAKSHDGYAFSPGTDRWRLSKEVSFSLANLRDVSRETSLGFRLALTRYAEEFSAHHTRGMRERFAEFIRDTKTATVTGVALINWRAQLNSRNEWKLGSLKGFLLTWHEWEFPGVSDEVAALLHGWRLKGNEKGKAVAQGDPHRGALSDIEALGILDWANGAVSRAEIKLETYAYFLTVMMTARRPVQIAALRGADLTTKTDRQGTAQYGIRFPRAKQRGRGFRQDFRQLPVIEDLFLTLRAQHEASVAEVEKTLQCAVPAKLAQQIPIFINNEVLHEITDVSTLHDMLMGEVPDRLHTPTHRLKYWITLCTAACTARSERTGDPIHLTSTRFRYTLGTNMRRDGCGPEEIAHALDQSDMQQVEVYTENTVQEAVIINRLMGATLAPFAQACMGTLVKSERDAIRGDISGSRVPNHNHEGVGTCGYYGFCAAGYRACYTCCRFQPWMFGPHKEVLGELYAEKERAAEAGCSIEVVNANDRLILAVEHCIALCEEAKAATPNDMEPLEKPQESVIDG